MSYATFTLAYWCVLLAALLPIACAGIAKWGMFTQPPKQGGFDNANPRAWLAAQANSFLPKLRTPVWVVAFAVNVVILLIGYR
jgi:uncharacterized MAPEG superfamily protein